MELYLDLLKVQITKLEAEYPFELFNTLKDTDEITIRVTYNTKFNRKEINPEIGFQFTAQSKLELFIERQEIKLISYTAQCQFSVKDEAINSASAEDLAKEIAFLSYPYAREIVAGTLINFGMPTALPYSPPMPTFNKD